MLSVHCRAEFDSVRSVSHYCSNMRDDQTLLLLLNRFCCFTQDLQVACRMSRRECPVGGLWSVKEGVIYAHAPATALECKSSLCAFTFDDSSDRNGPLRVRPRTHTIGVLTAIKQLASEIAALDCPVAARGVVAMRPLIIHASSKSLIKTTRRVLHIKYAARNGPG
jgi:hypothetical protein